MNEEQPSKEAVEAALAYVGNYVGGVPSYNWRLCPNAEMAARILAAEVKRLREIEP